MIVLFGYIASTLLAISLMTSNAIRFRWLNIAGCFFFIAYGIFIHALPVILANSFLLVINVYQTVKLYSVKENFALVPFKMGDMFVDQFLRFYRDDIHTFFPNFHFVDHPKLIAFAVLRNLTISNIFLAHLNEDGYAVVEINYTVVNYRDYKVGRFIFDKEKEYLILLGIRHIVYQEVFNTSHRHFIKAMGFTQQMWNGNTCWIKSLEL